MHEQTTTKKKKVLQKIHATYKKYKHHIITIKHGKIQPTNTKLKKHKKKNK